MDFLKDFGVKPLFLAAQVVNFLVLLFILNKLLYKPILKVLSERRKKIEDSLKNAEEIERKLLETEEQKEEVLAKTQEEIQKMIDEAKREIENMKAEGKQQAEALAAQIIKKGEEEARANVVRVEQQLLEKFGHFVALGMQKVTGKVVTKDQRKIIDEEIKHIS